jgi:nucleoside-diphosphate-sugar epimerase
MDWKRKQVLITGGASFISSHVIDHLAAKGAVRIRVVDDLSSGQPENLAHHIESGLVEFVNADLLMPGIAEAAVNGVDVVFHLAAIHGGRGYVDLHQAECSKNLLLDALIIRAAHEAQVAKFVFASSGCVYPSYLQQNTAQELYLTEEMVGPPYDADHMYGWAKLMCEMSLQAWNRDHGLKSVSCRFFTVYGERGVENHAVMAMIARAFIGQNPFEIWGDGSQIRNWTYVGDIASGIIAAADSDVEDGRAINLGTNERTTVLECAREVLRYTGRQAELKFRLDMPTGPLNRVADPTLAKTLIGWEPEVSFFDGLHRTIDWYFATKDVDHVRSYFDRMLTERGEIRAPRQLAKKPV